MLNMQADYWPTLRSCGSVAEGDLLGRGGGGESCNADTEACVTKGGNGFTAISQMPVE